MSKKDIYVQQIPLNPKATYDAKQSPPTSEVDDNNKYIRYSNVGEDYYPDNDRYSLTLLEVTRSSNTATALYNTRARFVAGTGASNEEMGDFIVNPADGTTVNDIIKILSKDVVKPKQYYIWTKLNENRTGIYSIERIAPQNARLGIPNSQNKVSKVHYSPYAFGSRDHGWHNASKSKTKPFYDELKRSPNQILYVNVDKEYNEYYPYPLDETQLNLFRSDAQITAFNYNNLKNNFFGGAIISIIGDPTQKVTVGTDEKTGKPIKSTWGEVMTDELSKTKVGADNAGNLTILWSKPDAGGNTEAPVISPVNSNTQADIFSTTLADITDNIARFIQVPTVLANIQVAGKLGGTEELLNNIDLLIANTEDERKNIERTLNKLLVRMPEWVSKFKDEPLIIQPLSMIRNIPDKVWNALTLDEQRDYIEKNYSIELREDSEVKETINVDDEKQKELEKAGEEAIQNIKNRQNG